jgi:Zn finger protein HypA/HybF involved in hydrogenase expression
MNTLSNPGSMKPYRFKSIRNIAASTLKKIKEGEFIAAFNFLIIESVNTLNKKKILNKKGKYYCPLCNNHSDPFIHMSNAFRFSFNSVCPYCTSRSRHRGLFFLYNKEVENLGSNNSILHFAPEPVFFIPFLKTSHLIPNNRLHFR